jgi:class 3 adenylate cyclase
MACGGLPDANKTHAFDVVLTALHIQHWMNEERERRQGNFWQVRLGAHTGDAVAGVIGKTKFAYDIWGNTVNLASRMESGGEVGKVNVTQQTFEAVQDFFEGSYREEIEAKNIGKVRAYFITRLKPEYAQDAFGFEPNEKFWEAYRHL